MKKTILFMGSFALWTLAACGGAVHYASPLGPIAPLLPTPVESTEKLQIFRKGDNQAREILAGVYPGDLVHLEARGIESGEILSWSSMDPEMGSINSSGDLEILKPGDFEIVVRVGSKQEKLEVRVGTERPFFGGEESPAPQPSPPASPFVSPTPQATAIATPNPSPHASPLPSPLASPKPTPKPSSDPYMDEVVKFTPGTGAGFGQDKMPGIVLGPPHGNGSGLGGLDVVSLGSGGQIILKSDLPILNGSGPDFIVFENPFFAGGNPQTPFAEPGEVAVSQDGENFVTFPCASDNSEELYPGCAGVHPVYANPDTNSIDPTDPSTAGGDAFDLQTIGLSWAQWVKITDKSVSGGGSTAGFDLDAIAIIHQ